MKIGGRRDVIVLVRKFPSISIGNMKPIQEIRPIHIFDGFHNALLGTEHLANFNFRSSELVHACTTTLPLPLDIKDDDDDGGG